MHGYYHKAVNDVLYAQGRQLSTGLNTLAMIECCLGCGPRSGAEGRVLRLG